MSDVIAMCRSETAPGMAYDMGCYLPQADAVVVPARGVWPSEDERQALIGHEWAHARGWRHAGATGRGTDPASTAPRGWIDQAVAAYPDVFGPLTPYNDPGNPAPAYAPQQALARAVAGDAGPQALQGLLALGAGR